MSKTAFIQKLPTFLVAMLPFGLVLTYDAQALDPVLHPRMLLLAIVLLPLFPLLAQRERFAAALKSVPSVFLMLFVLAELISWLLYSRGEGGLVVILKDLSLFLLFLTVSTLKWNQTHTEYLARSAIASVILIAVFALSEDILPHWQGSFQQFPYVELSGRMAHHNLLASALLLLIPLCLAATTPPSRWAGYLAVLLALVLLYLTRSRSAMLGAACALAVFILLHFLKSRLPFVGISMRNTGGLLLVLLIPLLLVQYRVLIPEAGEGQALQSELLKTSGTDKNFTTGERLQMWDYTLAMIQDHGLFGVGCGEWKIEFPMYGSEVYRARQGIVQFQRPHNDYLWIWAESGIVGLIFYLGFVVTVILQALQNLRKPHPNLTKLVLTGFVAALVVALFSFPRERILHQVLFFTFAGIINSGGEMTQAKPLTKLVRNVLVFFSTAALLLTAFAGYQRWRGERLTRKMIIARSNSNWNELIALERKTDRLHFYQLSPVGMPMEFYSGLAYLNQKKLRLALSEYEIARNHHPNNLQVTNNLANTYNLLGNTDSALVFYRKAIEISPHYKEGILNLASTYFNAGQNSKAYALLRQKAAEFDQDKNLYEKYVLTILRNWAAEKGVDLESVSNHQLLKLHYTLAYDWSDSSPWPFIQAQVGND